MLARLVWVGKQPWSPRLLATVLERLTGQGRLLSELLGPLKGIPTARYPQAIVVAAAINESWSRSNLTAFLETLRVSVVLESLEQPAAGAEDATTVQVHAKQATRSKSKPRKAA